MDLVPVSSSNLAAVGYDGSTLTVQFHSGWVYEYYRVPPNVYEGLMSAASMGRYLNVLIRPFYYCQRIA